MAVDKLMALIGAMDTGEKLFFRRNYSSSHSSQDTPLFLRLFDGISKGVCLSDGEILRVLGPDLHKGNLSYLKNYLFKELSQCLLLRKLDKDPLFELHREWMLVRILREKGLYSDARKYAKQLLQKAEGSEQETIIWGVLDEVQKNTWYESPYSDFNDLHESLGLAKMRFKQIADLAQLSEIYNRALLIKRKTHFKPTEEDAVNIDLLLSHHLIVQNSMPGHFLATHRFRVVHAVLLYLKSDSKAHEFASENLLEWHANPRKISEAPEDYLEALSIFVYTAIRAEDYNRFFVEMGNSFSGSINNPVLQNTVEATRYLALNRAYNKTAQYEKVEDVLRILIERTPVWSDRISPEVHSTLLISIAISCFVLERYSEAYQFAREGSLLLGTHSRKEHRSFAFLFLLIISFEKDDLSFFESQYHRTYHFFYKKEKPQPFETLIMRSMRKAAAFSGQEQTSIFKNLIAELKANETEIQRNVFTFFNVPRWLESKVKRVAYREWVSHLVRNNFESKQ